MLQKLHHTPYYMIMDSTYLLTCLVEIFYLECNMMPLKYLKNHKLFYSFKLIIQLLNFQT
jgi:hypothetical protein